MEVSEGLIGNAVVLVALGLAWWRTVVHVDDKIERLSDRLSGQLNDLRDRISRIEGRLDPATLPPPVD